ncbi:MAG: hypothetical protein VXU42_07045, partial [Verrucomicrobiota bacterium]|nr:hypothetical protein [Verrucomicrobiota bacterium]
KTETGRDGGLDRPGRRTRPDSGGEGAGQLPPGCVHELPEPRLRRAGEGRTEERLIAPYFIRPNVDLI